MPEHTLNLLSARGEATPRHPLIGTLALKGFALDFRNGDHKLKEARVIVQPRRVHVAWSDNDGNDPIGYTVQLGQVPGRRMPSAGASIRTPVGGGAPRVALASASAVVDSRLATASNRSTPASARSASSSIPLGVSAMRSSSLRMLPRVPETIRRRAWR